MSVRSKDFAANLQLLNIDSVNVLHTLIELTPEAQEHQEEILEFLESVQTKDLEACLLKPTGIVKIIVLLGA